MKADIQQIKRALKAGKIEELFKEELGWNKLPEAAPEIPYKGQTYVFKSLVQKAGFKIYQHTFHGHIPEDRFLYQLDKGIDLQECGHERYADRF